MPISLFWQKCIRILRYWVTREGIQPMPKKAQAILAIQPPKDKRQLRRFIGMINITETSGCKDQRSWRTWRITAMAKSKGAIVLIL